MLGNPYKYAAYELMNYHMALVGPVVLDLGIADRIGVYISNESGLKVYKGKPLIKVERKLDPKLKGLMDYNYFVYEPNETLYPTLIFKWLSCHRNTFLETYFGIQ